MAKAGGKKKNRGKRASVGRIGAGMGNIHPLIVQAAGNGAQLTRGEYEVASVPNPYGEVVVRDELVRHKAVRRVPHFETLYRSKVIDRQMFACLEWYSDRAELAGSGLIRCGLDVSGSGGGGSAHAHIPTGEAALWARRDVDWARGLIPRDCLAAFDNVMTEGVSFIESARRICADRYVRTSVERQRRVAREQFVKATQALVIGVLPRITETEGLGILCA